MKKTIILGALLIFASSAFAQATRTATYYNSGTGQSKNDKDTYQQAACRSYYNDKNARNGMHDNAETRASDAAMPIMCGCYYENNEATRQNRQKHDPK